MEADTPTAERVEKHISAMMDSVGYINQNITESCTEEIKRRVDANVKHLKTMLQKSFIASHKSDKTVFSTAITSGEEYLANNQ